MQELKTMSKTRLLCLARYSIRCEMKEIAKEMYLKKLGGYSVEKMKELLSQDDELTCRIDELMKQKPQKD